MKQKGAAIRSTLAAIETLHGAAIAKRIRRALPHDLRALLEPVILATSWYPIEVSAAIHTAVRDEIGAGSWGASHAIGIEAARSDFTGVHRVFLRASEYDSIWDRSQRAWDKYNSQGVVRWTDRERTSATGLIERVTGFNLGIWNAIAGRCEAMIRLAGAVGAHVEVADSTSTRCRLQAMWPG